MHINTKVLISGLVLAGSLLAQPPGGRRGPGPMGFGGPAPAETVTGAPYSAVEVRTFQQVLPAGNVIQHQDQTNVYRDTQGRVRRETTSTGPDGQTRTRVSISDPVAGVVHELDVKNKTAFSHPAHIPGRARPPAAEARATRTDANVKHETLAAQSIHGLVASGSRVTRTIPAGAIGNSQAIESVRETWMADDLKVPLTTKVSDPRTGSMVMELTNVNRSQPDPALFQVPADYTVRNAPGGPRGRGRQ